MDRELAALRRVLQTWTTPLGLAGDVDQIEAGSDRLLTVAELEQFRNSVVKVRRASGAARGIARRLCGEIGAGAPDILRDRDGAPCWPVGMIGSLSHDDAVAAAVLGFSDATLRGVGLDIEASGALDVDLVQHVLTPLEREHLSYSSFDAKTAFAIKEAVFKSVYPVDRKFLEFHQVVLDFEHARAMTDSGRVVRWAASRHPRVLALAWW